MMSKLAMKAKKVIDAAWLHGDAYDLSAQAAFALESAQLLQPPETAAERERLRVALESAKRGRRRQRSRVTELERLLATSDQASETNFWWYVGQKDRADAARDDAVAALTEAAELTPEHAEALLERARVIAQAPTWPALQPTIKAYRAGWDSMPLGLYATPRAARAHCEAHARRDLPTATFDWIEDEEDGVAELVATVDGEEGPTGYTVTALEIASEYDEEADE
ncbi:hypothetical protein ACIHFC_29030 [Streptomyces sp. NPDC052013]|uniref:hypothetical protein n=1 Tax=Streptomyces sp. NPDC052013 TaxID=3365679 RepID=UPI0037D517DA